VVWIGLDDKLTAEVVKSHDLEKELHEVKDSL
jgi:Arc/MetJ family transcription regulator